MDMLNEITALLSNSTFDHIIKVFGGAIMLLIYNQGRRLLNRQKLIEYKQIAMNFALGESLRNGYKDRYEEKLEELKQDNKFIIKGE
jgi:hypothetical protein